MARLGRKFPFHPHLVNLPAQTLQEAAGLAAVSSMTAGSAVTLNNSVTLTCVSAIGANQNAAQLFAVSTLTAVNTLTLQQTATLSGDCEISAVATENFNSGAVLSGVSAIGTSSNVTQSSTMAGVSTLIATPTSGNLTLVASIAAASGTDSMGNSYPQGLCVGIPLGPQSLFDVSGNATIDGNLMVGGSITNTALSATLLTYANAISVLQSQIATDATNINILQNQVAALQSSVTTLQSTVATQASQISVLNSILTSLPLSFLGGLSKLPHQSDNNTTLAGVLAWANNLTDNLINNGFMHT